MEVKLFTAAEASALVPFLEAKMERLRAAQGELTATRRHLEVLALIAGSGAGDDNPDVRARAAAEARVRELVREMEEQIEALEARGCVVKDLDRGRVDFYSRRGDRLVFLCWQPGEAEVGFWHPLEGDAGARRPLEPHAG